MNRRTFLHIGLGKAGSTSLQHGFSHHPEIQRIQPRHDPIAQFLEYKSISPEALFDSGEDPRVRVLSDERFSFFTPAEYAAINRTDFAWNQLRVALADWAAESMRDAEVIIVTRRQESLIPSAYAHYVRDGGTLPYPAFLSAYRAMFRAMLDSAFLVDLYRARFGAESVHVLSFEEMAQRPDEFCGRISSLLGLNAPLKLPKRRLNAAPDFSSVIQSAFARRHPDGQINTSWNHAEPVKPFVPAGYPNLGEEQSKRYLLLSISEAADREHCLLSLAHFCSVGAKAKIGAITLYRPSTEAAFDFRFLDLAQCLAPNASLAVTSSTATIVERWTATPYEWSFPQDYDPCQAPYPLSPSAQLSALREICTHKPLRCDTSDAERLVQDWLYAQDISTPYVLIQARPDYLANDRIWEIIVSAATELGFSVVTLVECPQFVSVTPRIHYFSFAADRPDLEIALRRKALFTIENDYARSWLGLADPQVRCLPLARGADLSELRLSNDLLWELLGWVAPMTIQHPELDSIISLALGGEARPQPALRRDQTIVFGLGQGARRIAEAGIPDTSIRYFASPSGTEESYNGMPVVSEAFAIQSGLPIAIASHTHGLVIYRRLLLKGVAPSRLLAFPPNQLF